MYLFLNSNSNNSDSFQKCLFPLPFPPISVKCKGISAKSKCPYPPSFLLILCPKCLCCHHFQRSHSFSVATVRFAVPPSSSSLSVSPIFLLPSPIISIVLLLSVSSHSFLSLLIFLSLSPSSSRFLSHDVFLLPSAIVSIISVVSLLPVRSRLLVFLSRLLSFPFSRCLVFFAFFRFPQNLIRCSCVINCPLKFLFKISCCFLVSSRDSFPARSSQRWGSRCCLYKVLFFHAYLSIARACLLSAVSIFVKYFVVRSTFSSTIVSNISKSFCPSEFLKSLFQLSIPKYLRRPL